MAATIVTATPTPISTSPMLKTLANGSQAGVAKMSVSGSKTGLGDHAAVRVARRDPADRRERPPDRPACSRRWPGSPRGCSRPRAAMSAEARRSRGCAGPRRGPRSSTRRRRPARRHPPTVPSGSVKSATWTRQPEQRERRPAEAQPSETLEPATEEVAGHDPDRDRVQDEHGPRSARAAELPPMAPSSWSSVVLEMADGEPGRDVRDGHVAAGRRGCPSAPARRRRAPASDGASGRCPRRPGRTARGGQRPVALDDRRCGRRRSPTRPKGTGSGRVVEDPLDLAEPVRQHLREMGEDSRGPQRRFRGVVEPLGERPRRARPRPPAGAPASRSLAARQIVPARSSAHGASVARGA